MDDHYEQGSEEQDMPKITRAAGPTYAEGETPEEVLAQQLVAADPDQIALTDLTTDEGPSATDYEGWTYSELQAECKARSLTATGSHEVLVERLVEDDRTTGGD